MATGMASARQRSLKFRTTLSVPAEIASVLVSSAVILGVLALIGGLDHADITYVVGLIGGQLVFLLGAYRRRDRGGVGDVDQP